MADLWYVQFVPINDNTLPQGGETEIPKGWEPFAVYNGFIVLRQSRYEYAHLAPADTPRETSRGHH
jgi:hypothetical protein